MQHGGYLGRFGAVAALALGVGAGGGCGEARPDFSSGLARLFEAESRHAVHIGSSADTSDLSRIGIIAAARVTASGSHVVVLDFVPPFVKVYRRDGALRAAFLNRGNGPQEVPNPAALAVTGDSVLLVAGITGELLAFDLDGNLLRRLGRPGFPTLAAGELCGLWVLYGPHFVVNGPSIWLHTVGFGHTSGVPVESLFADSAHPDMLPVGRPYGIATRDSTLVVRHDLGTPPQLLTWNCGEGRASATTPPGAEFLQAAYRSRSVANKIRAFALRSGARSSAGLAWVGGDLLLADVILDASLEADGYTVFQMLTASGVAQAAVPGMYMLQHTRPGVGVLFSTSDPVPTVFLLSEDTLRDAFQSATR